MKICSRQGSFELVSVNYSARSGGIYFSISFNMKVCCVFSESPHRDDSSYGIFFPKDSRMNSKKLR